MSVPNSQVCSLGNSPSVHRDIDAHLGPMALFPLEKGPCSARLTVTDLRSSSTSATSMRV